MIDRLRSAVARGAGATAALAKERDRLVTAIDKEVVVLDKRLARLRPLAVSGDADSAALVVSITGTLGELKRTRSVLSASSPQVVTAS